MKFSVLLAVLLLFLSQSSRAQEETLMGSGEIASGGFGAPVVKFTEITGDPAVLVGGRGGWIVNHTFVLGAGGYGLVTMHKTQDPLAFVFPYGEMEDWNSNTSSNRINCCTTLFIFFWEVGPSHTGTNIRRMNGRIFMMCILPTTRSLWSNRPSILSSMSLPSSG